MSEMAGTREQGGINWRVIGWGAAAALLALPFVAMQFTREVNWTASDFVFAGVLFALVGLGLEVAFRASSSWAWRGGAALLVLSCFALLWVNAAVGMIGDGPTTHNLLFVSLVPLALAGAAIVRLRAAGMAFVAGAAGLAQVAIAASALGIDQRGAVFSIVMSGSWFLAAILFAAAAGKRGG